MPRHFNLRIDRRGPRRWTPEKRMLAYEMAAAGAYIYEISKAVGISMSSVQTALNGIPRGPRSNVQERRDYACATTKAPESVLADRSRRLEAQSKQNYTSSFFGDPPPGYSALDKRRARA